MIFGTSPRTNSNEIELITSKDAEQRQPSPIRPICVYGRLRGYAYQLGRSPRVLWPQRGIDHLARAALRSCQMTIRLDCCPADLMKLISHTRASESTFDHRTMRLVVSALEGAPDNVARIPKRMLDCEHSE